jgi:excisionase family DNA binding protein
MSKIQKHHVSKTAYIYVRQSKWTQVLNNLESKRRQYALVDHARQLGWSAVEIIDDDQGRSGCGDVHRRGFEELLALVCQGAVGAVFALEASRLARNGQEWHRLLEFCAIVDTLIVDHDGVYDPKHPNDRLLLGMKGTMSELEIATFRQRSQEAIRQKARRGEYYNRIAEGYILRDDRRMEKDPDQQVRSILDMVFAKFREMGSARQVYLWFRQENIKLPSRLEPMGNQVVFVPATPWLVTRFLKDPTYAGAYAFGRSKRRVTLENGQKRVLRHRHLHPEDWEVLLKDHHDSYVSWVEYLKNQETLLQNRNELGEKVRGSARGGKGLLAGLIRCGRCGKKMHLQYSGRSSRQSVVYYLCRASQHESIGKQNCCTFGGVTVEHAVVAAVLDALTPIRVDAMMDAAAQLDQRHAAKRQQIEFDVARARYEADLCQRQYQAVDPANRLVAKTLEDRWNQALAQVDQLLKELTATETTQQPLSADDRAKLSRLGCDLQQLWNHEAAPFDLKKRILRTVIHEIVVYVEKKTLRALIHWQGGQHTELHVRKRKSGEHRWKTEEGTLELIRQLARLMSDKQIAAQLNRMGITSSKGHTWTRTRVGNCRQINDILNYSPGERQTRGELTLEETAQKLGVSYSTVQRMVRAKQLPAHQVCPGAPWIIQAKDLENMKKKSPSSAASNQGVLEFPEDI